MSDFEVHDPRFGGFFMGNAALEKLAGGFRWAEGPVWFGDAGCLLFSDIPNNRIMRWSEGGLSVYRQPSNYTNGHTRAAPIPPDLWTELKHEGLVREDAPTP